MNSLILKTTRSQYGSPFDAMRMITLSCDDGRCHWPHISCHRRHRKGARGSGQSLLREHPASIHSRGYSATREQAMADFKAQWLAQPT